MYTTNQVCEQNCVELIGEFVKICIFLLWKIIVNEKKA
jgi:hypothetical protein